MTEPISEDVIRAADAALRDCPGRNEHRHLYRIGECCITAAVTAALNETASKQRIQTEARVERILAECDAIEAEVHGQHDEDDDGMREAVRRIREAAQ